jgi:hypothetical protein
MGRNWAAARVRRSEGDEKRTAVAGPACTRVAGEGRAPAAAECGAEVGTRMGTGMGTGMGTAALRQAPGVRKLQASQAPPRRAGRFSRVQRTTGIVHRPETGAASLTV